MSTYIVIGVPGSGSRSSDGSGSFLGLPSRLQLEIEADSQAMAYVKAHRYWSSLGYEVVARSMGAQRTGLDDQPLGFSEQELQQIQDEGVDLQRDYPDGEGIQVEDIYEKTGEAV